MPSKLYGLKFFILLFIVVDASHIVQTTNVNGEQLNIIVWICPDLDLYEIVEYAIQHYSSVDDITNAIQQLIGGYRDLLWTVNALVYTRTTADLMPTKRTTSKNLCFVSVTQENIIVYVAAMAADL